jgi:hypothetical protein
MRRWLSLSLLGGIIVLGIAVGIVYGRDLLRPPSVPKPPTPPLEATSPADELPRVELTPTPTPPPPPAPTPLQGVADRPATPTPEPGGQVIALAPQPGAAGWWASGDTRTNRLGDSYLYAGVLDNQVFLSAARFDLQAVPRGAPIRQAELTLTGLRDDRLARLPTSVWSVQLLADSALPDFARSDFQGLFNAPAAITASAFSGRLGPGRGTGQSLATGSGCPGWLEQRLLAGDTAVIVRIVGPTGGAGDLFAWDSGMGAATSRAGPQLLLSLGPAPATPPALPTAVVLVGQLPPTPANVLTAAADALTATAVAATIGTYTPTPYNWVTPTPLAANLETVQARASLLGLPPVVIHTPAPANAATAQALAAYATAVAVTTGTFTPVPADAVTAIILMPTPVPENVMTAAAQMIAATDFARRVGTPTPLPYNAVIATATPTPFVVTSTPTPANAATVQIQVALATAAALTTGTWTPLPRNAVTATPQPLLLFLDEMPPTPGPSPTPFGIPPELSGKILFLSDRSGMTSVYAFDPATGRIALVSQPWVYDMARAAEPRSPDGQFAVVVQNRLERDAQVPQLYIYSFQYGDTRELTRTTGASYDPAWSPRGDRVAFVSLEPGNEEIYVINVDGSNLQRLTQNTWEWDKHPSWSPDGSQIVFWSNRGSGRRQLWVMNADGSGQRTLFDSPFNDWDPVWVK